MIENSTFVCNFVLNSHLYFLYLGLKMHAKKHSFPFKVKKKSKIISQNLSLSFKIGN